MKQLAMWLNECACWPLKFTQSTRIASSINRCLKKMQRCIWKLGRKDSLLHAPIKKKYTKKLSTEKKCTVWEWTSFNWTQKYKMLKRYWHHRALNKHNMTYQQKIEQGIKDRIEGDVRQEISCWKRELSYCMLRETVITR